MAKKMTPAEAQARYLRDQRKAFAAATYRLPRGSKLGKRVLHDYGGYLLVQLVDAAGQVRGVLYRRQLPVPGDEPQRLYHRKPKKKDDDHG